MAKMFYTMDETKAALNKNEEEIKQLTREGRLREYRDGAKLMYKADQVDQLKNELAGGGGGGEPMELSGGESGAPIGLADSKGGSGSVIGLADSIGKEDSSLAADLGASGTGIPSPGKSGSRTATGITVFGMEEGERADPSAQTAAAPAQGADQINLESVGSGSGLLDLTRESDDTSLGAELLDEIQPGAKAKRPAKPAPGGGASQSGTEATLAGVESAVVRTAPPQIMTTEAPDALAPALGAASLCGGLILIFASIALISACLGYNPAFLDSIVQNRGLLILAGFFAVPVHIFFFAGLFVGKARR
ncbi:MAG TPA: hypothetical protein VG722_10495 [Tepidisphaeraceae bacterium]|nr:hypothetical protein [Tepidisphaeraceae bacterium]